MKAFWSLKGQNPWSDTIFFLEKNEDKKPRTGQGYDNYDRKETIEFGCTQHESKRKRALSR